LPTSCCRRGDHTYLAKAVTWRALGPKASPATGGSWLQRPRTCSARLLAGRSDPPCGGLGPAVRECPRTTSSDADPLVSFVGASVAADVLRLLDDVQQWVEESQGKPEPDPAAGSDLAKDAAALNPYYPWHLAWSSRRISQAYMDTFRQLLTQVRSVHTHPPLGLLRGGLEAAALHLWLIRPDSHRERCRRGTVAWHRDLGDRAGFEAVTHWQAPAQGKPATARQAELVHVAQELGLSGKQRDLRCSTTHVITQAAEEIGVAGNEAKRLWSLSSAGWRTRSGTAGCCSWSRPPARSRGSSSTRRRLRPAKS